MLAGLLLCSLPAAGQFQAGDLSMSVNGLLSAGYNANYGDTVASGHSLVLGGSGTLNGSYYNPNFLNYTFSPYYNRSQDRKSVV